MKHTALGVTAFAISVALLAFVVIFGITRAALGVPAMSEPGKGVLSFACGLFYVLFAASGVLGIFALFRSDRKMFFAVMSLAVNGLLFLVGFVLFVLYD